MMKEMKEVEEDLANLEKLSPEDIEKLKQKQDKLAEAKTRLKSLTGSKFLSKYQLTCMPVIRFPNFSDKTVDIPLDEFYVIVGNQKAGQPLEKVSLKALAELP